MVRKCLNTKADIILFLFHTAHNENTGSMDKRGDFGRYMYIAKTTISLQTSSGKLTYVPTFHTYNGILACYVFIFPGDAVVLSCG